MKNSKTLIIARAAVICALYVALTYACMPLAYGIFQVRIGEALTILPLLYPEAIPALFIGCILSNIGSPFGFYDIIIGSFATLVAATLTYIVGKKIKNKPLKIFLGGLPPVFVNALVLPAMWFLFDFDTGYVLNMASLLLTQSVFVYALGTPLFIAADRLKSKNVKGFQSCECNLFAKKKKPETVKTEPETIEVDIDNQSK